MKIQVIIFLSLGIELSAISAQGLYDTNTIQDIKINFYQDNWDDLLDSLKGLPDEPYLLAQSVEINGEVFDSVGVKYKGYSSFDTSNLKNPLHIDLNHFRKGQNYHGVKSIKLANGFSDPSFVRQVLSYEILRKYMAAPQANYAKVWVNGDYRGLYTNVESINKGFVRKHFQTDGDNPFFKCTPKDVVGSTGHCDLKYESTDSVDYYQRYEIRSDYGWAELLALMDTLTNFPSKARNVVDVDRALWMLAFNDVLVNLDSYTGLFSQNYYLYQDKHDRWLPIVWDLNMSFGAFPLLDGSTLLTISQMKQLDPLVHENNDFRPLIKSLLQDSLYRRMYLAHLRTLLEENFSTQSYQTRALELQAMIDSAVQADNYKFYSHDDFLKNVTHTVVAPGGFGTVPGLTDLMSGRYNYLINNTNLSTPPPVISNVSESLDGEIYVHANVAGATFVMLAYRYDSSGIFQNLTMFDDGQHDDGAAGDGVYGQSFPYNGLVAQYYIYAENAGSGAFSPQRAEYEFYKANLVPPNPGVGDVVINEFLVKNTSSETDEAGQMEDWLELYNNNDADFSLTGMYLTDDPAKPDKWLFPLGTSVPAKGFLIVWLDEDQSQGPLHASFKLKADGEFLMLSNGAGGVVDSLSFGLQKADTSYGRFPNGSGPFFFMPRTFNTFNQLTVSTVETNRHADLRIFPNPVGGRLTIQSDGPLGLIRVFDTLGQEVWRLDAGDARVSDINATNLGAGIYCLKIGDNSPRLICVQH